MTWATPSLVSGMRDAELRERLRVMLGFEFLEE